MDDLFLLPVPPWVFLYPEGFCFTSYAFVEQTDTKTKIFRFITGKRNIEMAMRMKEKRLGNTHSINGSKRIRPALITILTIAS